MEAINKLTNAQLERLAYLSEELGETIQAVGKIIRHGYDHQHPDFESEETNRDDLEKELGHVTLAMFMLVNSGDLCYEKIEMSTKIKKELIKKYLYYQE